MISPVYIASWPGWTVTGAAWVAVLATLLIRRRDMDERWFVVGVLAAFVIALAVGHLNTRYEGTVVTGGETYSVRSGGGMSRVPVIVWRSPDRREHTVRATWELVRQARPGMTIRKRAFRWYPDLQPADTAP